MQDKPFVVALEEHYWDADPVTMIFGREGNRISDAEKRLSDAERRLLDVGELRLREWTKRASTCRFSLTAHPARSRWGAELAARITRQTNDRLHAIVQTNPNRFAAFAILPTPTPKAAADELERTVTSRAQ